MSTILSPPEFFSSAEVCRVCRLSVPAEGNSLQASPSPATTCKVRGCPQPGHPVPPQDDDIQPRACCLSFLSSLADRGLSLVFFRNRKIMQFAFFLSGWKRRLPLVVWISPVVFSDKKSIIWSTFGSYSCAEYLVSPLTPGGRSNQGLHLQGKKLAITTVGLERVIGWVCVRVSRWWWPRGRVAWNPPAPSVLRQRWSGEEGDFKFSFCPTPLPQKHGCHYHC